MGSKTSSSPDPYVRAFLRQAAAIIAAERGYNEISHAKLKRVASQLGLTAEAFQSAVEKLNKPGIGLGLNSYENKFVEFLSTKMKSIRGAVLSIRSEDHLVKLAETKYQIDPVRAHQLIAKTAEQFQVGTISHSDVEQFAHHLIEQAVGNSTSLDEENVHRLYHVCMTWGLTNEYVDVLLANCFTENRQSRRKRITIAWSGILIAAGLAATVYYAFVNFDRLFLLVDNHAATDVSVATQSNPAGNYPTWWRNDLVEISNQLSQADSRYQALAGRIISIDADVRRSAYNQLLLRALDNSRTNEQMDQLLAFLYLHEPENSVADDIYQRLAGLLLVSTLDKPASASQIRRSSSALQLLGASLELASNTKTAFAHRTQRLNELAREFLDDEIVIGSAGEFSRQATPLLTQDQWSHAIKFSRSYPKEVAGFLTELELRNSTGRGFFVNELRTRVVQSIIAQQPIQWKTIRKSLANSIQQSGTAKTNDWIDILVNTNDQDFSQFLMKQLAAHLDFSSRKNKRTTILEVLKTYRTTHSTARNPGSVHSANQKLERLIRSCNRQILNTGIAIDRPVPGAVETSELPGLIDTIAQTNNLLLAWITTTNSTQNYTQFNNLCSDQRWETVSSDNVDQRTNAKPPAPSETRKLREAFQKIFDSDPDQVNTRISALHSLQNIAKKIPSIRYATAKTFVEYLVRDKGIQESLAIDRTLPDLSDWIQLQLAIADHVDAGKLDLDKGIDLSNRLGLTTPGLERADDRQDEFQRHILDYSLAKARVSGNFLSDQKRWSHFEADMKKNYAQRLAILDNQNDFISTKSIAEILDSGMKRIIEKMPESRQPLLLRQLEFLLQKSSSLEQIVLCNQLLTEFTDIENEVGSMQLALEHTNKTNNLGERLLISELLLYQKHLSQRRMQLMGIAQ